MKEYLKKLDVWLSRNAERVRYGNPLKEKDIVQFEAENKFNLSEDLRAFFQWNNGIRIGGDYRFFSLQEALRLCKSETQEADTDTLADWSEFASQEEALLFHEVFKASDKARKKDKEFWLPIFAEYRASGTTYCSVWLSEIEKDNPEWVLIESKLHGELGLVEPRSGRTVLPFDYQQVWAGVASPNSLFFNYIWRREGGSTVPLRRIFGRT